MKTYTFRYRIDTTESTMRTFVCEAPRLSVALKLFHLELKKCPEPVQIVFSLYDVTNSCGKLSNRFLKYEQVVSLENQA